ncbi:3209_t:CDS:1, partial [Scutellospora calospora]
YNVGQYAIQVHHKEKIKHNGEVDKQNTLHKFFKVDFHEVEEQYYVLFSRSTYY